MTTTAEHEAFIDATPEDEYLLACPEHELFEPYADCPRCFGTQLIRLTEAEIPAYREQVGPADWE